MYKAYKFRLYPNDNQKILINKTFGCTRFIYNHFLNKCKEEKFIKAYDMCKELKELVLDYPFLKEVDSMALRCSIFNLEDSYKNYFSKRSAYPSFKNKFSKQSYRTNCITSVYKNKKYSNIKIDIKEKMIKVPKLGLVKIRGYRNLNELTDRIINITIEKEKTNKYYVSVITEKEEETPKKITPTSIVGIDLGIKDLVVTSDGEKYPNPKEINKREKRLKRMQRKLCRQVKGSNNYNKTKEKIARIHSKIKNSRKHNIITIANKIVKEHDIIVSEKLNVKKMSSNHKLAKNILDAGFNKICELLKWKAKLLGKYYYQVDTYYPSSKICSHCDNKTEITNDLKVRMWECENCGNTNDRDINASINIMFEGIKIHFAS
ncbi:iS1341-type transposase [Clostridium sp. CAG:710]|nr:iS1341-type transposase [Clostridium sp. CAG:710]